MNFRKFLYSKARNRVVLSNEYNQISRLRGSDPMPELHITRKIMSEKLNKSESTIKEHLARMKNDGLITRVGSDRSGYWVISSQTNDPHDNKS